MSDRAKNWFWPTAVTVLALVLRLWHLERPRTMSFDERYYALNAWSLLQVGYEQRAHEGAWDRVAAGDTTAIYTPGLPDQVVHPEAAKWLIAAGEYVFGLNSFGWRIASAIVGTLTVLVVCRLALRLTSSVFFGCLAGFLVALDGLHLTLSRLALLDIFVTFWIVCAVACLVADRDWIAARLSSANDRYRLWRPWQLAAGVCFGLACGSKWNGVYALAAFGVAVVVWELFLRMSYGPVRLGRTTVAVGAPAFGWLVVVAAVVYVVTCLNWLINHDVYEERFGHGWGNEPAWGAYVDNEDRGPIGESVDALRSLWHYQAMSYRFHTGDYLAKQTHPYQSDARGWLLLARPVTAATELHIPAKECGALETSYCMRETNLLGNPAVWWSGVLAMLACAALLISTARWQYSVPVIGLLCTWAPWLAVRDRPIFSFYAVATLPFIALALALALQAAWQSAETQRQRQLAASAIGLLVALTVAAAIFFWPIWTHELISREQWWSRMWIRPLRSQNPGTPASTVSTFFGNWV